jgi:hypothetical protein
MCDTLPLDKFGTTAVSEISRNIEEVSSERERAGLTVRGLTT